MSLRDQHAALAASILAAHSVTLPKRLQLIPGLTYEMIDLIGELVAAIELLQEQTQNDRKDRG